ncbi:MAG: aldehyde dehydrogenase [Clostridiales bacterium]|nr:aldehyde dehydrogenase [Clostridiales bacterium]
MSENQLTQIVTEQKAFFAVGKTLDVKFRKKYLSSLYNAIKANLDDIHNALHADLGKSASESYMCETGLVMSEISFMLKHVKKFSKAKRAKTPLVHFASKSYRLPSPYGTVLVLSPWNYPFLLAMGPLVDALAAGNTVVLKTSSSAPNTSEVIKKIIDDVFPREYVAAVYGKEYNEALWQEKYDYVFFTGSKNIGKFVYGKAAENLTPVTLELGGKSPCIVDKSANVKLAAKRIVWGKYLNCGQTCVAPDYVFCDESVKGKLIEELKTQIQKQFGSSPLDNSAYGKIVNAKHFERIKGLIDENKIVCGGKSNVDTLKIEPTVLDNVTFDDAVMGEEIFGPVLPIVTYTDEREIVSYVSSHDSPLALYVFSTDRKFIKRITRNLGFGGGCVNDVVIHLANPHVPFGGFGASGMGAYHGKVGFETFTHYKSIVDKKNFIDLPMRYQPYKKSNDNLIKFFLK